MYIGTAKRYSALHIRAGNFADSNAHAQYITQLLYDIGRCIKTYCVIYKTYQAMSK
jgi:hypothetical protein